MKANPLISIIIPVLNGELHLERCFSTLEGQKYPNLEIIFIDNGSQDGSRKKIEECCDKYDNYFLLDCNKPGPGATRNVGIRFSHGEYISFLDIDDELEPDKYIILLNEIKQNPDAAIIFGRTKKIFSDGREIMMDLGNLDIGLNKSPAPGLFWLQQFQHHPHISSSMIRREVVLNVNGFPEEILYGEDIALSVKIGINNNIIYSDALVSTYHRHSESAISRANQYLSSTERYFQFYEKFALPYFSNKSYGESFKEALSLSEGIAFGLIMKLIKLEKKEYYKKKLYYLQSKDYIKKIFFRMLIYKLFPYNISSYIYQKLFGK